MHSCVAIESLSETTNLKLKLYSSLDTPSPAVELDPTVPTFSKVNVPSKVTLLVYLYRARPLSKSRRPRSGLFWMVGRPTLLLDWQTERRRFARTHMVETDNDLKILVTERFWPPSEAHRPVFRHSPWFTADPCISSSCCPCNVPVVYDAGTRTEGASGKGSYRSRRMPPRDHPVPPFALTIERAWTAFLRHE